MYLKNRQTFRHKLFCNYFRRKNVTPKSKKKTEVSSLEGSQSYLIMCQSSRIIDLIRPQWSLQYLFKVYTRRKWFTNYLPLCVGAEKPLRELYDIKFDKGVRSGMWIWSWFSLCVFNNTRSSTFCFKKYREKK